VISLIFFNIEVLSSQPFKWLKICSMVENLGIFNQWRNYGGKHGTLPPLLKKLNFFPLPPPYIFSQKYLKKFFGQIFPFNTEIVFF
jgi:hypothetical protein